MSLLMAVSKVLRSMDSRITDKGIFLAGVSAEASCRSNQVEQARQPFEDVRAKIALRRDAGSSILSQLTS
eukprot:754949-Hanusia_phi.AAC.4